MTNIYNTLVADDKPISRAKPQYKVICLDDHDQYVWATRSQSWDNFADAQRYADTCAPQRKPLVLNIEGLGVTLS